MSTEESTGATPRAQAMAARPATRRAAGGRTTGAAKKATGRTTKTVKATAKKTPGPQARRDEGR